MNFTMIEQILDTKETLYAENADCSGSSSGYEYSGVHEAMKEIAIEFGHFISSNWRDVEDGVEIKTLFEKFNNS